MLIRERMGFGLKAIHRAKGTEGIRRHGDRPEQEKTMPSNILGRKTSRPSKDEDVTASMVSLDPDTFPGERKNSSWEPSSLMGKLKKTLSGKKADRIDEGEKKRTKNGDEGSKPPSRSNSDRLSVSEISEMESLRLSEAPSPSVLPLDQLKTIRGAPPTLQRGGQIAIHLPEAAGS
eukprot:CAMPEP_0184685326 /NCGR_PEP_ID=MMETSP0312-20130426/18601_1 /TAXON_ID=31354 /ORGANISM="Compsopogon coeruleus, Strain SAG 36.94" /LENGTH=175 /DNA_ID=CAMNT_0027139329 /DNA_START=524 /DNA_END=1047 /DNA_ORIENTATION=+